MCTKGRWRRSWGTLAQRSLQADFSHAGQRFRQRAVALGGLGDFLELRLVDAGNNGFQRERNAVDDEAFTLWRQIHAGLGID